MSKGSSINLNMKFGMLSIRNGTLINFKSFNDVFDTAPSGPDNKLRANTVRILIYLMNLARLSFHKRTFRLLINGRKCL